MSHILTSNLIGNHFLKSDFQWYLIGILFYKIRINLDHDPILILWEKFKDHGITNLCNIYYNIG